MNTLPDNYYTMKQAVTLMSEKSKGKNSYQYCRKILNNLCIKNKVVGACKVGSFWLVPKNEIEKLCTVRYNTIG